VLCGHRRSACAGLVALWRYARHGVCATRPTTVIR